MIRKVWLESDQFDLEALAEHLQSGHSRVVREGDDYYLTSPEIDAAPDDVQANDIAAKIIGRINALGRIHDPNFRPVKLSRYTDDTGQSVVTGAIGTTLSPVRARFGEPDPSSSPWPDYLAVADRDAEVARALAIEAADIAPLTVKGSMGQQVVSPFIAEARAQRALLAQLLGRLGLPDSDEAIAEKAEKLSRTRRQAAKSARLKVVR